MKKWLLAFDMDGTLTDHHVELENEVLDFLKTLYKEGHKLVFLTGRSYHRSLQALKHFDQPYLLALQNGAAILEMPSQKLLSRRYLDTHLLDSLSRYCSNEPTDFVIYGGFETKDTCYYRKEAFSKDLLEYLLQRAKKVLETWVELDSYQHLPFTSFASCKVIGPKESVRRITQKVEASHTLSMPLCSDPINATYMIGQATSLEANKGEALLFCKQYFSKDIQGTIACGDDYNDIMMLQKADISIAMETAPKEVLTLADIIAKPAKDQGIIQAVQKALTL